VLHREKKSVNFLLSTLESYHQNPSGDQTQLISYTPESDVVKLKIIDKSSELRTAAYWKEGESWVFAGGLEPSLYTYKFKDQSVNKIKIDLPWSGWIHGIGVYKNNLAVSSSGSSVGPLNKGIYHLDLSTHKVTFTKFPNNFDGMYSAVDTIDPSGRIWFYTAYPYKTGWLDNNGVITRRYIPNHPDWEVLSWDAWLGDQVVVKNNKGEVKMLDVENFLTFNILEQWDKGVDFIPVDLYHRWQPQSDIRLFFNKKEGMFTSLDPFGKVIDSYTAPKFFGKLILDRPREFGLVWEGVNGGEYIVLGVVDKKLIVHRVGTKEYYWYNNLGNLVTTTNISAKNLTPASISSIGYNAKNESGGQIMLSGALTHGEAVSWDSEKDKITYLGQLIPHLEGQIDWLKYDTTSDAFFGGAYPNAIIFYTKLDKIEGASKVDIIWRSDKIKKYNHFQRVISLNVSQNKTLVAAIVKSDYSEKKETALIVHDGKFNKTTMLNALEIGVKKFLSVMIDKENNIWVLAEDHKRNLVLVLYNGKKIINIEKKSTEDEVFIGEINGDIFYFNGREIKKIKNNCTVSPCSKNVLSGYIPDKTFVFKNNQSLLILTENKLECFNEGGLRTVKEMNIDARFLRYNQIAIGDNSLYFGYRDNLHKIGLNNVCK